MESFKKVISLNQASQISGYSQDYLGFLLRQGEIKGLKKGRVWFTTEGEIKNYLFKKKVRNQEFAFKEFFFSYRTRNIIIVTLVIFACLFFVLSNFYKTKDIPVKEIRSATSSDGASINITD